MVTSFHENYGQGCGGGVPSASLAGEEVAYSGTGGTYSRKCDTQVLLLNWTHVKAGDQSKVDIIKFEKSLML